jgi:tetratricopeptide (TPR) repeat protein
MKRFFYPLTVAAGLMLMPFSSQSQGLTEVTPIDTNALNPDAQEKYNEGVTAMEAKNWDAAADKFTEAIKLEPRFTKAYMNRGTAYFSSKKYDNAIADFDYVAKKNDTTAHYAWFMKATAQTEKGELGGALESMQEAVRLNARKPHYHYELGVLFFRMDNYKDAIGAFDIAIRLKSDYAYALNDRGSAKKKAGDLDGAMKDYENAIRSNPQLTFAYNNLGTVKRLKGDFEGAIQEYNNAIRLKPDYYIAVNNRGMAKMEAGRLDEAITDFTEAIRIKSDYAFAYNNRAAAYIKKEKYKEAVADCDKAIQLDANYGGAFLNRGIAKEMLRDLEGACNDWLSAATLGIESAEAYYNIGFCSDIEKYKN